MWALMIGNALINAEWLTAFCVMIYLGHPVWAGFCLFGAFVGGYSFKKKSS